MVALDEYTTTNGATVVVPKSHTWDNEKIPDPSDAIPVVMPAGSIVYFLSTLWHGGGRNVSNRDRMALTVQYCQVNEFFNFPLQDAAPGLTSQKPWIRQLENMMLVVDFDQLDKLPPRLVEMLGYKVGAPFIGYVDGRNPRVAVERMMERYRHQHKDRDSRL